MKPGCALFFLLYSASTATTTTYVQAPDTTATAPCLLAGAPTFDLSISRFREDPNSQNPSLPLNEFRIIDSSPNKANLTRAASKANENLHTFTALERGTLKVKSIQVTWLPIREPEQKAAKTKAQEYMTAVIRTLTPLMIKTQSQEKLQSLLTTRKNKRYYTEMKDTLRYVVADDGEKELTSAVEPIKLTLSESLEGLNK